VRISPFWLCLEFPAINFIVPCSSKIDQELSEIDRLEKEQKDKERSAKELRISMVRVIILSRIGRGRFSMALFLL